MVDDGDLDGRPGQEGHHCGEGQRETGPRGGDEEAEELPRTDGNILDLEEVVRDSIVADLPYSPLCEADCEGLCPECGVRLADAEKGHAHESIDPRLAVLADLLEGE